MRVGVEKEADFEIENLNLSCCNKKKIDFELQMSALTMVNLSVAHVCIYIFRVERYI